MKKQTKRCKHYWAYDHTIYSGDVVRRKCTDCGRQEYGRINKWRKITNLLKWGEFELLGEVDSHPVEDRYHYSVSNMDIYG